MVDNEFTSVILAQAYSIVNLIATGVWRTYYCAIWHGLFYYTNNDNRGSS